MQNKNEEIDMTEATNYEAPTPKSVDNLDDLDSILAEVIPTEEKNNKTNTKCNGKEDFMEKDNNNK